MGPPTWPGVVMAVVALTLAGGLLLFWSRSTRWGRKHVLAAAGPALVLYAALSFVVEPLGKPSYAAKYAANAVLLLGVLALLAWAYRRLHRAENTAGEDEPASGGEAPPSGALTS